MQNLFLMKFRKLHFSQEKKEIKVKRQDNSLEILVNVNFLNLINCAKGALNLKFSSCKATCET